MKLISIQDALSAVIENTPTGKVKKGSLNACASSYLAQNIVAPINLPGFNNSAMDGYVFRYEDYENGCRTFSQTHTVKAGDAVPENLEPNTCFRIFTGAPVPENGTLVIMQEHILVSGNQITIDEDGSKYFQNIRLHGEQIKAGKVALKKGTELSPAAIGYLASLGVSKVETIAKPVVTVLTTGNELVKPGEKLQSGQIFESNSAALVAGFEQEGINAQTENGIPDDYESTLNTIREQLNKNDFLVLTGGISVGEYDFVGKALHDLGVETVFYKVNQKPGKPFFFGKTETCSVFALPGNPAAAMSCFYYYLVPALRKFMGAAQPENLSFLLPLKHNFKAKGTRDMMLKARIINNEIEILDGQSSNMMHTFALANALVLIEAKNCELNAGDLVRVINLNNG